MSFLYPVFLSALAILLIPVLVHLFRFRKYRTFRFTRVRLLKEVEIETKNRNRLKHLITLLCRMLALACLVMAFAIPSCNEDVVRATGKTRVSIYIDNSFSMDNGRDGQILLEAAKQRAREIVNSYGNSGEFQIRTAKVSGYSSRFTTSAEAISFIDEIKIQSGSPQLDGLLQNMAEDLKQAGNAHSAYVISDFQTGFVGAPKSLPELKGVSVYFVKIRSGKRDNIGIDSAWLQKPYLVPGEKNSIQFRVANFSSESLTDFPVKLYTESGLLGTGRISVAANAIGTSSIEFTAENKSYNPGKLVIEESGAAFDNVLYVNLSAHTARNVGISQPNRFVDRVLETQPFLKRNSSVNPFSGQTSGSNDVFIWTGPGNVSQKQAEAMRDWLSVSGATCIMAADVNSPNEGMENIFGLPESKSENAERRISDKGFSHPFFSGIFEKVPQNMNVPQVKKDLSTSGANGSGEAILSLENGDPLMLRFSVGKGFLYYFTSPIAEEAGNLVKSPLFLPLLTHAMIAGHANPPLYGISQSKTVLPLHNWEKQGEKPPVLKLNELEVMAEISPSFQGKGVFLGSQPEQAGNYQIKENGTGKQQGCVSVNVSRLESNPNAASEEIMENWRSSNGIEWISGDKAIAAFQAKISDTSAWHLFIWLAAVFFALEVLVLVFWDYRFKTQIKSQ
ncbi:MAG: vWA domain-containing protein [Sphingomonadales bacterium]